jgi:transcriptional regulator with XRE-family HTH domain
MPADPHLALRDTVRQALAARKLSQASAARLAGIHVSVFSRWLNGKVNLSSASLAMLLQALGISLTPPKND